MNCLKKELGLAPSEYGANVVYKAHAARPFVENYFEPFLNHPLCLWHPQLNDINDVNHPRFDKVCDNLSVLL